MRPFRRGRPWRRKFIPIGANLQTACCEGCLLAGSGGPAGGGLRVGRAFTGTAALGCRVTCYGQASSACSSRRGRVQKGEGARSATALRLGCIQGRTRIQPALRPKSCWIQHALAWLGRRAAHDPKGQGLARRFSGHTGSTPRIGCSIAAASPPGTSRTSPLGRRWWRSTARRRSGSWWSSHHR